MSLTGKAIVVTGASGIAEAAALRFGERGAAIHFISIDEDDCQRLADKLRDRGVEAGWSCADLSQEPQAEAAFQDATRRLGGLDGLFAVAGGSGRRFGDGPADGIPQAGWDKTLDLNLTPAFLALREAVRSMDGGSVALVSSVLARHPSDLFATHAYAAAKGAINSLTIAAASRYARSGIRVNAIAPGLVRTPMSERAAADPETMAYARRKQPLAQGMLSPESVADVALFLMSDASAMITGQIISVDGGWSVVEVSE